MSAIPLAELCEVRKSYGDRVALAGASLSVHPGEVVALLGANGAGKSTAIRVLLGLRRPDSGRARVGGRDPTRAGARRLLGWTPQETDLPETLRVSEAVDLVRAHYARPARREELAHRFGITDLLPREAGGLSGGQRRRVAVALAFAGEPELVVLDEPSSGLDRAARAGLWSAIRGSASAGRGILLATHDLAEAAALASRVVVLDRGRIVLAGTLDEIRRLAGGSRVELRRQPLPPLEHGSPAEGGEETLTLVTDAPGALLRELLDADVDLDGHLRVEPMPLGAALARLERR